MSLQPTMRLITSPWNGQKTFKLMPVSDECPFTEGIFDPTARMLVLMSKDTKESVHLLPRLDTNGDPIKAKGTRQNGKNFQEQRVTLDTFTEHYIIEKDEIIDLIKTIAVNADTYDFGKYLEEPSLIVTPSGENVGGIVKP